MGQCYGIYMKYKFKDESGLVKALKSFIVEHDGKDCRFNLDMWKDGFNLDRFGNLMRVFFSNAGSENQLTWGVPMKAPEGMTEDECERKGIPHWTKHQCRRNPQTGKYETSDVLWIKASSDGDGFHAFESGFDASYGWEMVMERAFEVMAKYLEDGSELDLDMDEGRRVFIVDGGEVKEE